MSRNYIDFISAYCDSWCERCAFTDRCSHFAVQSAVAMCDGDFKAALELAVGPARAPGRERQKTFGERMMDFMSANEPTERELEEIGREMEERTQRAARHPLAEASLDYAVATRRWLEAHDRCTDEPTLAVHDAIDVISWDSHLIHIKIMRALEGRDEYPDGDFCDQGPVQSDWNGSAKVALISIERSEAAWTRVATDTADEPASVIAGHLAMLRRLMHTEFPRAGEFRRPGFDDPTCVP